ncbi:MAG: hypothetical protein O3B22_17315 [Proteobacteria bacterium]|nr:hypothetical protein [Pseudomonadota bacterium]
MPLQNRVTPRGEIVADPARGLYLGNRGCLCDAAGELARRRWRLKAWITCALSYKGWWRPVMQPGVWTELFFLDEATALAAGHRPCALCRREAYERFVAAWQQGNGLAERPRAIAIDAVMHKDRVRRDRSKVTYSAPAAELPAGTMVEREGVAWLLQGAVMLPWSPSGYGSARRRPEGAVTVLTPRSTVAALAAGYTPHLHDSTQASG